MSKIELTYELKNAACQLAPVNLKILPGAYPLVVIENMNHDSTAIIAMLREVMATYKLDETRLAVIGHYPKPEQIGGDTIEWMYCDFKRERDLKLGRNSWSIRKLDPNLVFALLEQAGWGEEMKQQSRPMNVLVETLKDGSREVFVIYHDGKKELRATLAAAISPTRLQEIARTIGAEVGVNEIKGLEN